MAKVEGPLHSQTARGTIAGKMEFSRRRGSNFVRYHQQPTGAASAGQTTERALYLEACEKWQELTSEQQALWIVFNES